MTYDGNYRQASVTGSLAVAVPDLTEGAEPGYNFSTLNFVEKELLHVFSFTQMKCILQMRTTMIEYF